MAFKHFSDFLIINCFFDKTFIIVARFARTLDYRQKCKRHLGDFLPYFDKCLKGQKSSNAWS